MNEWEWINLILTICISIGSILLGYGLSELVIWFKRRN